jgi:hypothetical protein
MSGEQIPEETILTPTARLARAEKQRQALARKSAGEQAWRSPEVLAFSSWIGRLRDDWFLTARSPRVPISASQALVLWQSVIDRDVFIGEPRVAEMAAASWRMIHEYRIDAPSDWPELSLSEDSRHFRDWAARFLQRCEARELIDEWRFAARLPELIEAGEIGLPERLRLSGFELPMTPLQQAIVNAAAAAGTRVERERSEQAAGSPEAVTACAEDADELLAAARWARTRLEENVDQGIAIVVPALRERLGAVERVFRRDAAALAVPGGLGRRSARPGRGARRAGSTPPLVAARRAAGLAGRRQRGEALFGSCGRMGGAATQPPRRRPAVEMGGAIPGRAQGRRFREGARPRQPGIPGAPALPRPARGLQRSRPGHRAAAVAGRGGTPAQRTRRGSRFP